MKIANQTSRKHFAVLHIEVINAMAAYANYRRLDPGAAQLRWPFKKTCAASVLTFSIQDGVFEFGTLRSFAAADEAALLRQLFVLLRQLGDHTLVTWGGLHHDLPILRVGAAEHQLKLPSALIHGARAHGERRHWDLAAETAAGAGHRVDLAEIACRLGLPAKLGGCGSLVPQLVQDRKWRRLSEIGEADAVTTALVLVSRLCSHGELISADAGHYVVLDEVCLRRPRARYHHHLARMRNSLAHKMEAAISAFLAAA